MEKNKKKYLRDSDPPSLMPSPADLIGWVLLFFLLFAVYAVAMVLWNTFHEAVNDVHTTTKQMSDWTKKKSDSLFPKSTASTLPQAKNSESQISSEQVLESFKQQFEKASQEVGAIVRGKPQKKPFDRSFDGSMSQQSSSAEAAQGQ